MHDVCMLEVRLRAWRPEDAQAIAAMTADAHVRRWSSLPDGVDAWLARERTGLRGPSRAICLNGDDRPLGKVALRLPGHASNATANAAIVPADHPAGELSYWLLPEARGRGLARVAVQAMMESIAATTALRSVVLDIEARNEASIRLAERLGAQRRAPERDEPDRLGTLQRLVVFVLQVRR
jgi:RimJ/RimL family protein N-acetyltransferase